MRTHLVKLGTFKVTSGRLVVSDPCYTELTEEAWLERQLGYILPAVNGTWKAYASFGRERDIEGMVTSLLATHENHVSHNDVLHHLPGDASVDSGQMSIFCVDQRPLVENPEDDQKDIDDDSWFYGRCCLQTMSGKRAGVLSGGCVSSSGFGDGGYNVSVTYEQGPGPCRAQLVNSVRVDFITEKDLRPDYER